VTHFNIWSEAGSSSIRRTSPTAFVPAAAVPSTLRALFLQRCAALGASIAYTIIADDLSIAGEVTFAELETRVLSLARALAARFHAGERILLAFDNGLDSVELFWACIVAGLVPIPAPAPRQLGDSGFKRLQGIAADSGASLIVSSSRCEDAARHFSVPWVSREALDAEAQGHALSFADIAESDVAYLQYTSGSTSEPRGVELTHANVMRHCAALSRVMVTEAAPGRILNWLPWFHDFGLLQGAISPVYLGITSYLMPTTTFMRRPLRWLEAISKFKISYSGAPDSAYLACVRALAGKTNWSADLSSWSLATSGGEPVRADTVQSFSQAFAPHGFNRQSLAPAYGMAETVLAISIKPTGELPQILYLDADALALNQVRDVTEGQVEAQRSLVGSGVILDGLEVCIVDPQTGEEQPPDTVGEIWVRGGSVGRGYWGKPDLSHNTFGARLSHEGDSDKAFLRTGDLGFVRDRQLFVSGRLKDIIVVHGRNIYPYDIEFTAQDAHSAVRASGVIAFGIERPDGEAVVLLAECTGKPSPALMQDVVSTLRREVSAEHGVEVHDVVLLKRGTLPHTSSGKPQRSAAKQAYLDGKFPEEARLQAPDTKTPSRAPSDAVERVVADIWMAVLNRDNCDVDADFFSQGGNSLIATQLVSRLNSAFGSDLPIRAVFDAPTIAGIAQKLRDLPMRSGLAPGLAQPLEKSGRAAGYPLSFSQERFWFVSQQMPESTAFHMPLALRLKGVINVAALQAAFTSVIGRHEILRTTFRGTLTGVEACVHDAMPIEIQRVKPTKAALSDELALERQLALLTQEPFDLERGPLIRVSLIEIGRDESVLLIVMHHIVGDQWSFAVLARELAHFYRTALGEDTTPLPPLAIQYADFAAWQTHTFDGERRRREEEYWHAELDGGEPVTIAPDYPRSHRLLYRGAQVRVPFRPDLIAKLTAVGARNSASLSMVMMTALTILLERYTGRSDISIGVSVANRNRAWSEALIGTFVNVLLLRTDVDRKLEFARLLERVRQTALDAFAHQEMPFDQLVRKLKHQRDASRSPLFQVLFNMINAPVGKIDFENLEISRINFDHGSSQFDLTVVVDAEHDFSICFEYALHVFQPETVARFAKHYLTLLDEIAAAGACPVARLAMMDGAEIAKVIELGRGAELVVAADTVVDWLKPAFGAWSDKAAILFEGSEISYRGLDDASEAVAMALRRRGIGRGHRVGLHLARSTEMIAAQLGVLKSGAAYVPLDPANPAARLGYIARDAGLSVILTDASDAPSHEWIGDIPALGMATCLSNNATDNQAIAGDPAGGQVGPDADDAAYVLYTSGSTGEPKGVVVSHRSLVNLLSSLAREPGISHSDRVLAITTLSFDISLVETLLPLGVGASIILASRADAGDGDALLRLVTTHEISFMQATPSTWHLLLNAGWAGSPHLKKVLVGGEPLTPRLATSLVERCDHVWNMYGPTETTVWSTFSRVQNPEGRAISIGRPIANTQVYVLDAELQPCPLGVEGDLFIGGLGVARGYVNLPELTAERFLPDPFAPGHREARIYKTGDRARWQNDGTLLHLGRSDTQVKLRGYRIELSEVEAHLQRHLQVDRAAVVVREISPGDPRLVAYVVPRGDALSADMLRQYLARFLPDYMLPQHIALIDTLPLLSSGKVDIKGLANITLHAPSTQTLKMPRSLDEQAVWEIWRDVLGFENFGIHENFFDLGGHSMLAVRVVNRVRAEVNATCAIPMLFQCPTIAELVVAMNGRIAIETPLIVPLQELGETPPLFCICGIHLYQDLANHLAPHRQVYAVFVPCELGILNGEVDEESFFISVEEIAADYIVEMQKKQPHGPYHLAGLSFGGLLAFEIAQQLRQKGEHVAFLAMFDTIMPMGRMEIVARRVLHNIIQRPLDSVSSTLVRGVSAVKKGLLSSNSLRREDATPAHAAVAEEARQTALRDALYMRASRRYTPRSYDGVAVLIRAEDSKIPDTSPLWGRVIEKLEVLSVPGDHLGILKAPYVGMVAQYMLARFGQERSSNVPLSDEGVSRLVTAVGRRG
jgi:amino acid adenylation domain-containing protein